CITPPGSPPQSLVVLSQLYSLLIFSYFPNAKTLVMIINRHRQYFLRFLLTNDILVKNGRYFMGFRQFVRITLNTVFLYLFANNVITQVDTFITNEYRGPSN